MNVVPFPEDYGDVATIDAEDVAPKLVAFTGTQLVRHRFPYRRVLLEREGIPVLRAGHLAQCYAERGMGKSLFVDAIGMAAATGTSALGFSAPEPLRVVKVAGEMASDEIQGRAISQEALLGLSLPDTFTVIAADWQPDFLPRVDTPAGQAALEEFIEWAELVIFDNRSCLTNTEAEKDAVAWMPMQQYLLSLRRRGKPARQNFKDALEKRHQGVNRAHSLLLLERASPTRSLGSRLTRRSSWSRGSSRSRRSPAGSTSRRTRSGTCPRPRSPTSSSRTSSTSRRPSCTGSRLGNRS